MKSDLVAAFVLAGFGSFVIHQALQLDYADQFGPGPGFIPFWVGVGLVALSFCLIYSTLKAAWQRAEKAPAARPPAKVLGAWAGLMAGIALLKTLGFFVSFALLSVSLVYLVDRRSLASAATVGLGSAVGFYLVFRLGLGLSLPAGPWGF
ncbi:MAG TPA: tripartite tricarboxylate transporter TctB family protein [Candidatus Acidoferrales bacterium]|nr:tripartite tricarboxylate transporter TctB family protein [Candidatus Acidoferrales bacterium]